MGRSFENRKISILKTAGQKSKLYSKYGKQLYVVAKNGVPDPESNPSLRLLIDKAKKDQVPAHVIDKALDKAKGTGGEDYSSATYEGFGPGGCIVMVDCLTDNPNRTITDVQNCFNKTDSKRGNPGSVSRLFDHLAIFSFKGDNDEAVLEALMEAEVEVEDVECKDGQINVFAPATEFYKAKQAIEQTWPETEFDTQEITYLPQADCEIKGDDVAMFEKFIDLLNDCEDVQDVYHNAKLPEEAS